jgi:hypothetical protein
MSAIGLAGVFRDVILEGAESDHFGIRSNVGDWNEQGQLLRALVEHVGGNIEGYGYDGREVASRLGADFIHDHGGDKFQNFTAFGRRKVHKPRYHEYGALDRFEM